MSLSGLPLDRRRHLRRFGVIVATGFSMLGALSWWRGHTTPPLVFWTLATLLIAPALVAPTWLAPVERAWLTLGGWLGWINTRIILTLVFYLVVTPVALLMRPFRDPLDRQLRKEQQSYWIKRTQVPFDAKRYQQQF